MIPNQLKNGGLNKNKKSISLCVLYIYMYIYSMIFYGSSTLIFTRPVVKKYTGLPLLKPWKWTYITVMCEGFQEGGTLNWAPMLPRDGSHRIGCDQGAFLWVGKTRPLLINILPRADFELGNIFINFFWILLTGFTF